jgi:hypothetical protein
MPRELLSLQTTDLSSFAKSLGRELAASVHPPGHQSLLNMLARAAGHRNLQSLRAADARPLPAAAAAPAAAWPLSDTARKALGQFDERGILVRWPQKHAVQRLVLWLLWTRIEARRVYSERQINDLLNAWHAFGDPATLRRELIGMKLLTRKPDCSDYRRLPGRATDEARALIQAWRRRTEEGVISPASARGSKPIPRSTR